MNSQPWEALMLERPFDHLSAEEQRDELLAAVGLLLEFVQQPGVMERYVLMPETVETMGLRYGPWSR